MARLARVVIPGRAHHVTQRGNRRQPIFFEEGDHAIYLDLLATQTTRYEVEIWAYCLMPNHVHLILVPAHPDALGLAVGETHRRYTNFINARARWTGHLFQSRFSSVLLDDSHFMQAMRYVTLNPVRARLVPSAEQWPWSSARAHLCGANDPLLQIEPVLDRIPHLKTWLRDPAEEDYAVLRRAETTGRPLGTQDFLSGVEQELGRPVARRRPGRKPELKTIDNQNLLLY